MPKQRFRTFKINWRLETEDQDLDINTTDLRVARLGNCEKEVAIAMALVRHEFSKTSAVNHAFIFDKAMEFCYAHLAKEVFTEGGVEAIAWGANG
jgi:hypothetical protein